jgi:hypothetical protein
MATFHSTTSMKRRSTPGLVGNRNNKRKHMAKAKKAPAKKKAAKKKK